GGGGGRRSLGLRSSREGGGVARALRRVPSRRFPDCARLLRALDASAAPRHDIELPSPLAPLIVGPADGVVAAVPGDVLTHLSGYVTELVASAAAPDVQQVGRARYLL